MEKFKAGLFDYDGVLVKSWVNLEAWTRTARVNGIVMKSLDFYINEGSAMQVALGLIKTRGRSELKPEELVRLKTELARTLEKKYHDKAFPESEEILSFLKNKDKSLGIVTGADTETVKKSIPGLLNYFDIAVTANDKVNGRTIKGKPDPEQYQVALQKLSLMPNECFVVENSPLGIRAAKSAGIFCIALMTTLERKYLEESGADLVLNNHRELLEYFRENL